MSTSRRLKKLQKAVREARQHDQPSGVPSDAFGLGRESRIVESDVRNVFTPHQPVAESNFLFGRQAEVASFISALNTPGRHALLYGDRGVGKTSLANVVRIIFQASTRKPYYLKRCDRNDNFESIVRDALISVGSNPLMTSLGKTFSRSRGADVDVPGLTFNSQSSESLSQEYDLLGFFTPSAVATALDRTDALLVIDEVDALKDNADREKLAELIKLLSDGHSPFKLMIVGIAETASELTAAHPSVRRCLSEKKLGRMADLELREIIVAGGRAINIAFDDEVVSAIVNMSVGYPHFTHLLALKSAEIAIGDCRSRITMSDLRAAIRLAVEDSEGSLTTSYAASVRSTSTDMFRTVVIAAAKIGKVEFSAPELRAQISHEIGQPVTQNSLNNYFQRLVSPDGSTILRRTAHGHYRFEDPRMASFVRMANGIMGTAV